MNKIYREYCTGCGLCKSINIAEMKIEENGFPVACNESDTYDSFFEKVCPAGGNYKTLLNSEVWGESKSIYLGWATDNIIRSKASSGGILTSLCMYMLNEGYVDGIIQTRSSETRPFETETIVSRSESDIISCCGSRYSISSPLLNISQILSSGEKYLFVGKPCDVFTLKKYIEQNKDIKKQVPFLFSFFCAGEPSLNAQKKLIEKLGATIDNCSTLKYRGDGWPGYATITTKEGHESKLSYEESWGGILGRDVRKICRFCLDGIGLAADLVCGDAWYLDDNGNPDFTEHDGRNLIICRNKEAEELVSKAKEEGYITVSEYTNANCELKLIQRYQFERRTTMFPMLFAMKLLGRNVPKYDLKKLKILSHNTDVAKRTKRFLGTVKRVYQNKI